MSQTIRLWEMNLNIIASKWLEQGSTEREDLMECAGPWPLGSV